MTLGTFTPDSYNQRVHAAYAAYWRATEGEGRFDQPARTAEELAARRIGDAERIAATLLSHTEATHSILRWWVDRIANDPSFAVPLYQFERFTPEQFYACGVRWGGEDSTADDVREFLDELSTAPPEGAWSFTLTNLQEGISSGTAYSATVPTARRQADKAILHLASAVVDHRLYHEPDTEHTEDIYGVMSIATSLAAAVVEYHGMIENIWARNLKRLQRESH